MPLDRPSRDQIRKWIAEGQVTSILSMLDTLKHQRDRAELQRDAYLHEIRELSKRTKNILEPLLNKSRGETPSTQTPPANSKSKAKPKGKSDLDIKITL